MAITDAQLGDTFRILEDRLFEQHKVRFTIQRHPTKGIEISARYGKKLVSESDDLDLRRPHEIVDDILHRAGTLKFALCAAALKELLGIDDRDESRRITNAAYEYRLACFELQPLWERMKMTPKDSALAAHYEKEHDTVRKKIEAKRDNLLKLARASALEPL